MHIDNEMYSNRFKHSWILNVKIATGFQTRQTCALIGKDDGFFNRGLQIPSLFKMWVV